MLMYVWGQLDCVDWKGVKRVGRMICRVKWAEVSLGDCIAKMTERIIFGMGQMGVPIGTDWHLHFHVTCDIPENRKCYLSFHPEPDGKPLRLVWEELRNGVPFPKEGA